MNCFVVTVLFLVVFAFILMWLFSDSKDSGSKYEKGYEWAKSEYAKGKTKAELEQYANNPFDFDDFDRGALAYLRTIPD